MTDHEQSIAYGIAVRDSIFQTMADWKEWLEGHRMLIIESFCSNLIKAPAMSVDLFDLGAGADADTFISMYATSKPELVGYLMPSFNAEALAVVASSKMMGDLTDVIDLYFRDSLEQLDTDLRSTVQDAIAIRAKE